MIICIKFGIRRRGDIASNAKQGAENVEWIEAGGIWRGVYGVIGYMGYMGYMGSDTII